MSWPLCGANSLPYSYEDSVAMPRTAPAVDPLAPRISSSPPPRAADGQALTPAERALLLRLQCQALEYFLDNQLPGGLILDRQRNHGPRHAHGLCSVAATGMGFIAVALASAPPYQLLTPHAAVSRVRTGLLTVLQDLPHDHGIVPHFLDSATGAVRGVDAFSTIDSSWLLTGALWAAAFLGNAELEALARQLYERVDWRYWTTPDEPQSMGLLRHGKDAERRFLAGCWDRLNGETAFMYVLAAGAEPERAVSDSSWRALRSFHGTVAGLRFHSADLGLFVFQYGLDLLDCERWQAPAEVDLWGEARLATQANELACREAAGTFSTYRRFWGLSAGDGPGPAPDGDSYRAYAPSGPVDGTAHLTATLASVAHHPAAVLRNVHEGENDSSLGLRGRYGFSNVNLDRQWVARDMVGIDAGATVLALDNYLMQNRVRDVFHSLTPVQRGLERLGFKTARSAAETPPVVRQAS